MMTALLWSKRGLCKLPGRDVGAVITTNDMKQILSIGYNGPPKGLPNSSCRGTREVQDGRICGCIHAEVNAIAQVDGRIGGKVLFVTLAPCEACALAAIQANISTVYYHDSYRNTNGIEVLEKCGVQVQQYQVDLIAWADQNERTKSTVKYDPHMIRVRGRTSKEV
jgi:dCMP deaminase